MGEQSNGHRLDIYPYRNNADEADWADPMSALSPGISVPNEDNQGIRLSWAIEEMSGPWLGCERVQRLGG
jgi:hypothetical protein